MSDETNPNGHIRPIAPAEVIGDVPPDSARFDTAAALLRLLVGGALVGMDELRVRLERWQEATQASAQTVHQTMRTECRHEPPPTRCAIHSWGCCSRPRHACDGDSPPWRRASRVSRASLVRPTSSLRHSDQTGIGHRSIHCGCVWTKCASERWRPLTGGLTVDGRKNNRAAAWHSKPQPV